MQKVKKIKKKRFKEIREIKNGYGLSTILVGLLIGAFAGLVVSLYRLALVKATGFIFPLYSLAIGKPWIIALVFLALALGGYIVGLFLKLEPMIGGSGIPQVEGILIGKMKFNWLRVLVFKFIGGIISLGSGLSLGREGPSVQLGSAAGLGVGRILRGNKKQRNAMMSFGAAAGLSAAFNAPLAGVLFVLEELHKSFSALLFIGAITSAIVADIIAKVFFGLKPVFDIPVTAHLGLNSIGYVVILGIVLGILGVAFNKAILWAVTKYDKVFKLPIEFKPVLPFLSAGVVGLFFPVLLGGGHELVQKLVSSNFTLELLFVILVGKFIFTIISYSSSAPGGIFLPLLSIGAVIGCIVAKVFVVYFGFNASYVNIFIILAMAGYFSAVVKSPITGILLLAEMTGSFESFLYIGIVCVVSYIVADILKGEPVYEMLLHNSLNKHKKLDIISLDEVVTLNIKLGKNSQCENKKLSELEIPNNGEIISVKRNDKELELNSELTLLEGDYIGVSVKEDFVGAVKVYFERKSFS